MDAPLEIFPRSDDPSGKDLVGREILVCWDDGVWYDAVIVRYFRAQDEYKLVYRADDGIEIAKLRDRRWMLSPKKKSRNGKPVLDGALIEFEYPADGKRYKAMVYDYSHRGERLKIAYLDEHTTDNIKGGGWDFITTSPCLEETPPDSSSSFVEDSEMVGSDPYDAMPSEGPENKSEGRGQKESGSSGLRRTRNASASRATRQSSSRKKHAS